MQSIRKLPISMINVQIYLGCYDHIPGLLIMYGKLDSKVHLCYEIFNGRHMQSLLRLHSQIDLFMNIEQFPQVYNFYQ